MINENDGRKAVTNFSYHLIFKVTVHYLIELKFKFVSEGDCAEQNNGNESLSVVSTSSAESLPSLETTTGVSPEQAPLLTLRQHRAQGAFTSYIRRRGEPDGRTGPPADHTLLVSNNS